MTSLKGCVALVCMIGCSPASTDVAADAASEAAVVADSFAETLRDTEGFGVDAGDANCTHDLCVDFDDGRYGPVGAMPFATTGASFGLDTSARSKPNCLLTTVPAPTDINAISTLNFSLPSGSATARFRFAMRLEPVTFDATQTESVILGTIALGGAKEGLQLAITRAGLVVNVSYGRATDGGWSSVPLPQRAFSKPPTFGVWVDVELSITPTADGSRALATVAGETLTIDVPPSFTEPGGVAKFTVGLLAIRPAPAMTARFDDLLIDVGK